MAKNNRMQKRAYKRALNLLSQLTCTHKRATANAEITLGEVNITHPTPLTNDPEERWKGASTTSRMLSWSDVQENDYRVDDTLEVVDGTEVYRIRATKPWPDIDPVYWELHLDAD